MNCIGLAVAHHAFVRSGAKAGDVAIIGGAGPIGALTAAVLQGEGLTVYVSELSELSELRRQRVLDAGVVDDAFDPREVDVGFEATSVGLVPEMLVEAVRPGGVTVNESIWGHEPSVARHRLVLQEIGLRGTIGYAGDHPATIKPIEDGTVDVRPFITGRIGFDELVSEGFETLIHHNETAVKILVSPTGKGLEQR